MYSDLYAYHDNVWYEFNTHRWFSSSDVLSLKTRISNEVFAEYQRVISYLTKEALANSDEQKMKHVQDLKRISLKLKDNTFKKKLVAECEEWFCVNKTFVSLFDEKKHLIGFENGVYDLDAAEFRSGRPEDMLTMSVGYDYNPVSDPDVRCKLKQFISDIMPDPDVAQFLLTRLAYCLHGDKFLHEVYFWIGVGANGKSVLCDLLSKTLGAYCYSPDVALVTTAKRDSSSANPELAKAKGTRLMIMSEPEDNVPFKTSLLKVRSGGDRIQARDLYQGMKEFVPQFAMIVTMNNPPNLSSHDRGICRRLRNVRFPSRFVESPNPNIPTEKKIDEHLTKYFMMLTVRQEFFNMLTETYQTFVSGSKKDLSVPKDVVAFTQSYLDANNCVGQFIKSHLEPAPESDYILFKTLHEDFLRITKVAMSITQFSMRMSQEGYESVRVKSKSNGHRDLRAYFGLRYRELEDKHSDSDDIDE
jgi:putative DNA primase/helicase